MPLQINTNIASLNAQRHLGVNTNMLAKSMEKLSSGLRINRAGDDAAGLALSEGLRAQMRGVEKAIGNTQDGINVLNLADGALQQITDNLQRMRELAVQAGNDTYNTAQRTAIDAEITAMAADNTRVLAATTFNGSAIFGATMNLQVGQNAVAANDTINVTTALASPTLTAVASITSNATAQTAIGVIDGNLATINAQRGTLGSFVNRLEGTANNLAIALENYSSSESRIRNVDVARESATLTKNQILQQASSAMLAQANQSPSLALQLLQN